MLTLAARLASTSESRLWALNSHVAVVSLFNLNSCLPHTPGGVPCLAESHMNCTIFSHLKSPNLNLPPSSPISSSVSSSFTFYVLSSMSLSLFPSQYILSVFFFLSPKNVWFLSLSCHKLFYSPFCPLSIHRTLRSSKS